MEDSHGISKKANLYAGRKLRELRGSDSQQAFSARIGMKQSTYSTIELGITGNTIPRLARIAKICGVPLSFFILPDDDPAWSENADEADEDEEGRTEQVA